MDAESQADSDNEPAVSKRDILLRRAAHLRNRRVNARGSSPPAQRVLSSYSKSDSSHLLSEEGSASPGSASHALPARIQDPVQSFTPGEVEQTSPSISPYRQNSLPAQGATFTSRSIALAHLENRQSTHEDHRFEEVPEDYMEIVDQDTRMGEGSGSDDDTERGDRMNTSSDNEISDESGSESGGVSGDESDDESVDGEQEDDIAERSADENDDMDLSDMDLDSHSNSRQLGMLEKILLSGHRNTEILKKIAKSLKASDNYSSPPRNGSRGRGNHNWRSWKRRPIRRDRVTLDLQKTIRLYLQALENRSDDPNEFLDQPSKSDVRAFHKGRNPGPTESRFRIHYGGTPCSPWNLEARKIFHKLFLKDYSEEPEWNFDSVKASFYSHIRSRRILYRKLNTKKSPEEQAIRRQKELKYTRRRTRRINLWNLRIAQVQSRSDLAAAEEVLVRLGAQGMSSDESDDESRHASDDEDQNPTFFIRRRTDRAEWITKLLRLLDKMHHEQRYPPGFERTRGGPPRTRKFSATLISKTRPMVGQPKNYYHSQFLAFLDEHDRASLAIRPSRQLELPRRYME
ncbi:hypothetical protein SISNIDRAFT_488172 [Sistotremastrum niveocremeum HHB9708]|uniref:Uncharacterized protein n=1 Tax=Sistotremastrum niveocremeum HHB9708 TaxID=1314777 RepID=A0A164RIX8_9AGAM|nr:hypothetical protein SISNIDRAFT_488172 [Sistotremastrum niveocremeum HHB9708]